MLTSLGDVVALVGEQQVELDLGIVDGVCIDDFA